MFKTLDSQIDTLRLYWSMQTIKVTTIDPFLFALYDQIALCIYYICIHILFGYIYVLFLSLTKFQRHVMFTYYRCQRLTWYGIFHIKNNTVGLLNADLKQKNAFLHGKKSTQQTFKMKIYRTCITWEEIQTTNFLIGIWDEVVPRQLLKMKKVTI